MAIPPITDPRLGDNGSDSSNTNTYNPKLDFLLCRCVGEIETSGTAEENLRKVFDGTRSASTSDETKITQIKYAYDLLVKSQLIHSAFQVFEDINPISTVEKKNFLSNYFHSNAQPTVESFYNLIKDVNSNHDFILLVYNAKRVLRGLCPIIIHKENYERMRRGVVGTYSNDSHFAKFHRFYEMRMELMNKPRVYTCDQVRAKLISNKGKLISLGVVTMILYGSTFKGTTNNYSDIDLNLFCDGSSGGISIIEIIKFLKTILGEKIDVAISHIGYLNEFKNKIGSYEEIS